MALFPGLVSYIDDVPWLCKRKKRSLVGTVFSHPGELRGRRGWWASYSTPKATAAGKQLAFLTASVAVSGILTALHLPCLGFNLLAAQSSHWLPVYSITILKSLVQICACGRNRYVQPFTSPCEEPSPRPHWFATGHGQGSLPAHCHPWWADLPVVVLLFAMLSRLFTCELLFVLEPMSLWISWDVVTIASGPSCSVGISSRTTTKHWNWNDEKPLHYTLFFHLWL